MENDADHPGDSALARLFDDFHHRGEAIAFSLPGGAPLFLAGESADRIFWLRSGRLGAFDPHGPHGPRFLGLIRPGEPAGEMSLMAGTPHGASVMAMRDSEILSLPRDTLLAAAEGDPALMAELARLVARRARASPDASAAGDPSVFGLIGVSDGVAVRSLAEKVADAIRLSGRRVVVVGAEHQNMATEWFSRVESLNDYVLYVAEVGEATWRAFAIRQADHLIRVASGEASPQAGFGVLPSSPHGEKPSDLVIIETGPGVPTGGARWAAAVSPTRIFRLRRGSAADTLRLARVVTGSAVGLVLSGGAARAFAHVGAIRALRARSVPIDFVAGSSMGAIIAAGIAMDWSDEELDARLRKAFVQSSPVADIAFPLVSLSRGALMRARLAEHFGDRDMSDLWLPFFCVSSNLTTGAYKVHRQGLVREALAASAALPGVLPPVIQGDDILVDGAIMNNFPADLLHPMNAGPIIGVDVSRGRSIDADDVAPASLWRWLLSGDWRRGPPIVSLLMRAATMSSARDLELSRSVTDVLIQPMVDDIEIRNWKAYDQAVAAGERAAMNALDRLDVEVVDLRRRGRTALHERSVPARRERSSLDKFDPGAWI